MFDWLKPASNLVDSIGDAIDKNVTSDEERLALKRDISKNSEDFTLAMEEADVKREVEITKRWESDNKDGSALAKNVRPASLVATLGFTFLLVIIDSWSTSFNVKPEYISLLSTLLMIMIPSYFTLREVGKGIQAWNKK